MEKYIIKAKYWGKSKSPIITEHTSLKEARKWLDENKDYEFIAGFHYTDIHYLWKYSITKVVEELIEEKEVEKRN